MVKDHTDVSEQIFFKSFQYFFCDLKKYVGFSIAILFIHSLILYFGSYMWVNYNGFYESQAFFDAYIHIGFDIGYLFSHNLWWLSLRVHTVVSIVCLTYAVLSKFFLLTGYFYEVVNFFYRLLFWCIPIIFISAFIIEDSYIFDYQTSVLICFMPGLFMMHLSVILVRTMPDLGDLHRLFLWCIYRNKTVTAMT
jgi:hypothetical protein